MGSNLASFKVINSEDRRVDCVILHNIRVGHQNGSLVYLPLESLTSGSLSHSASLHSLVTLLWVVELESFSWESLREESALRSGGGGGNSSSVCRKPQFKILFLFKQWCGSIPNTVH